MSSEDMCVGPHCQCFGIASQHARDHALPPDLRSAVRLPQKKAARAKRRSVLAPLWVAWGPSAIRGCPEQDDGLEMAPPRYHVFQARAPTGRLNMFRRKIDALGAAVDDQPPESLGSRCQVPLQVYKQHEEVATSLRAGKNFCETLEQRIVECLGTRGVNDDMRTVVDLCCTVWDWEFLLFNMPTRQHADAVLKLWDILKPRLERTFWPSQILGFVSGNTWRILGYREHALSTASWGLAILVLDSYIMQNR